MQKFEFQPIGVVRSAARYRFEAPRQGVFNGGSGVIELLPAYGGDAIADLEGFERIWVIFCFHLNLGHPWKARVQVPYPANGVCRSLFATRSPYRVNPIGMSCVKVEKIGRNQIFISESDILDNTPVLDIKPYIPEADSFPGAAAGWRDEADERVWQVRPQQEFIRQAEFIKSLSGLDILQFCQVQLASAPLDASRKRLFPAAEAGFWRLGCRTWRIVFKCDERRAAVDLCRIESNYQPEELLPEAEDKYRDKEFHRRFLAVFNW